MPRTNGQKLKLLLLADILRRQSDEGHPLSAKEIMSHLEQLGVSVERKSFYADIELLRDTYGLDVISVRVGPVTKYYVGQRDFEPAELQLLADAVACSKFISEKKSSELIKKLGTLTSEYQQGELIRSVVVANRVKTENQKIYYNVQTIHDAINEKRRIRFKYFNYGVDKKKQYKSDEYYEMSPYSLAWEDENYYCIGYYEKYGSISNFRVDRMEQIQITDIPIIESEDFCIADYSRKVFGMFSGETVRAKIVFDNSLTSVVMDKFGSNVTMHRSDENRFFISREVNISPTFYAWMLQFADKAEIVYPPELIEGMKNHIRKCARVYRAKRKQTGENGDE